MRSDAVYHGRNFDRESDRYKRCSRCGFPCKIDRDVSAPEGSKIGWGITNTSYDVCYKIYNDPTINYAGGSESYNTPIEYSKADCTYSTGRDASKDVNYSGIEKTIYDPIVKQGCPQCGCLLY
jgi:hypothetical protein